MNTYFISDIHLHAGSAENSKLLLEFLQTVGPNADAIYILGDLFAIWFGDDIKEPYSEQLFSALKNVSNKVPIFFMRGNRDFLVDHKFSVFTGAKILPDPSVINLYGESVLLTHGDLLCTADISYQRFRAKVQHPLIKALFLALPKLIRTKLGEFVRKKSMSSRGYASDKIDLYDVVPASAKAWFEEFKVNKIIHGHTHKPAIHQDGKNTRIVLGDWTQQSAKILVCNENGYSLLDLRV